MGIAADWRYIGWERSGPQEPRIKPEGALEGPKTSRSSQRAQKGILKSWSKVLSGAK
jgi:hypothetical protein